MFVALAYVGSSLIILAVLTFVYVVEDIRGKRLFLLGFRSYLDGLLLKLLAALKRFGSFFTHGFMRVLLHYGAHTILKRVLTTLRRLESRVENLVRQNRKIAKDIHTSKTNNHLNAIAEHKEEVALSEEERRDRLSR